MLKRIFSLLIIFTTISWNFSAIAEEPSPTSPTLINIPKSKITSLETKDGGILCYITDFTPESVNQYLITGTHWHIAMKLKEQVTVLDDYDWQLGLNENGTTRREDTFNGVKVSNKVNDQYIIYGYGIRNQVKGATYQCGVSIITQSGLGPYSLTYATATFNTNDFKPVPVKSTITCKKGQISKKIVAISPTCPKGYKKVK